MIGLAMWLCRLLYAALIATAGSLVMLALRRPITLHAGPRATVGLWSFLLLVTALALLWLNGHDMLLSQFMMRFDSPKALWIQLGLYDMRYMYPPKNGVFASLVMLGGLGFTWSGDVTAPVAAAFGVWALGTVVFWLRVLIPHLRLRRALRRLPAADDPELERAIYLERSWLGITREVKAYILPGSGRGKRVFSPCVTGVRSPALVLPGDIWAELSPEERDAVVAHELMHVRKRDNVRNLVLLVFHGVFWFAPVFRIALRAMRRDLEFLRDRQVLGEGATGREKKVYADAIVSVAERCSKEYRPALHSGMLTGSGVGFRVRLLDGEKRGGLRVFAWLAVLAAALCILAAAAVFFYIPYFTDKTLPWWYRFFLW